MPAIFVTAWAMQQQVFDAEDIEALELPRAFGTHAPQCRDRRRKRRDGSIHEHGRHRKPQYKRAETASTGNPLRVAKNLP
jgi:hypothetical protein